MPVRETVIESFETDWARIPIGVPVGRDLPADLLDYTRRHNMVAGYIHTPVCHTGIENCYTVTLINFNAQQAASKRLRGDAVKLAGWFARRYHQDTVTVMFPDRTVNVRPDHGSD